MFFLFILWGTFLFAEKFCTVELLVLNKTTHSVNKVIFDKEDEENCLSSLTITCEESMIDEIDDQLDVYCAKIKIEQVMEDDSKKLLYHGWENNLITNFEHPEWAIKLVEIK